MNSTVILLQSFLLQSCLGIGLFSLMVNPKIIGFGLVKLITSICIGLGLMALILIGLSPPPTMTSSIFFLVLSLISMVITFQFCDERKTFFVIGTYLNTVSCLFLSLIFFHNLGIKSIMFSLTSSLFLGSTVYAMLLGHWYLVTPKLSTNPLKMAHYMIFCLFFFKLAWTGLELFSTGHLPQTEAGYTFDMLILSMRFLWGYLGFVIMGIFSWKLVNMRSLQSATGMLYAMTFLVLIGELIAGHIYLKTGLIF